MGPGAVTLADELLGLLPAMVDARATHLDWAEWLETHPERLTHEPGLGDVAHHREQVRVYDDRMRIVKAAAKALKEKGDRHEGE